MNDLIIQPDANTSTTSQRYVERQEDEQVLSHRRLNPFAFPAETNARFNLFALASLTWVLNWTLVIGMTAADFFIDSSQHPEATAPGGNLWWLVGLPMAVVGLAVFLYITHPRRIIRHTELQPLDPTKDAAFTRTLAQLSEVAQLPAVPTIMLRNTKQIGGQAFGLPGRYILRLDSGLRLVLRKSSKVFRAIVLHEMAHITNRDINRTYLSQSLWTATLWGTIIPFLLMLVFSLIGSRLPILMAGEFSSDDVQKLLVTSLPLFFLTLVQLFLVLLFVAANRASLLRVREVYTDWRAATWGAGDALIEILQRNKKAQSEPSTVWKRFTEFLHLHPSAAERIRFLRKPRKLFEISLDLPLFVGWLASISILGCINLLLILPLGFGMIVVGGMFFIVAVLVVGSLGVQVLREAVGDLGFGRSGPKRYLRLLIPATLVAVGLYLGIFTSPLLHSFLSAQSFSLFPLIQFVFFSAMIWGCLIGLRYSGRRLLGCHTGANLPVGMCRLLIAGFGVLVSVVFVVFLLWQFADVSHAPSVASGDGLNRDTMLLMDRLVGALFILMGAIPAGVVIPSFWRWVNPPCCPRCRTKAEQKHVIGQKCRQCSAELTPWLFIAQ